MSRQNNKNAFRKQVKRYSYDKETGVLYKTVKSSDGIGKYDKVIVTTIEHSILKT